MATLYTEWEKCQLQHVHLLLQQATETLKEFEKKNEDLRRNTEGYQDDGTDNTKDWLKFRGFTFDLYSVLDYTYFLLRSHFANKGVPDHSFRVASKCGFPYKRSGVKISSCDNQDQHKKFMAEKLHFMFGDKLGECTHFWKHTGDVILSVQPKLQVGKDGRPVDNEGQPTDSDDPKISTLDEESFALLHHFRNYSTHRDLIHFLPEKSWVEINQATREIKLVKEQQEREGFYYYTLDKGYWIHLPEDVIIGKDCDRLLLDVLHQLLEFVKGITRKLLSIARLLLPKHILEHHYDGQLEIIKPNPVDGMQVIEAAITSKDGTRCTVKSDPHKQLREAEQDGCIKLLNELVKSKVLPTPPYTHLIPCYIQPIPPVIGLMKTAQKNYRGLKNEFKQQMSLLEFQVNETLNEPCCVNDNGQLYKTVFKLHIVKKDTGEKVLELQSREHQEIGKDNVKQAAVKEVIEECIMLGIIDLKYQ